MIAQRGLVLFLILFLLTVHYVKSWGEYSRDHVKRRDSQKYCGQKLVNALYIVCNGNYNSMFKRSYFPDDALENAIADMKSESMLKNEFKERSRAQALSSFFLRRRKRGISDECCYKSCSVKELSEYCAY